MIELILPFPPSVNNYKKIGHMTRTKSGKLYQTRVNSNETKMFYFSVWQIVKSRMGREGSKFFADETIRLEVWVYLHPPHDKRYDADNRLKVLLDSLMHAKVIKDDSQIYLLHVQKCERIEQGRVRVIIKELS